MSDDEFEPAATVPGKVYVPKARGPKKHPCPDCMECGWCGDERCRLCRGSAGKSEIQRGDREETA